MRRPRIWAARTARCGAFSSSIRPSQTRSSPAMAGARPRPGRGGRPVRGSARGRRTARPSRPSSSRAGSVPSKAPGRAGRRPVLERGHVAVQFVEDLAPGRQRRVLVADDQQVVVAGTARRAPVSSRRTGRRAKPSRSVRHRGPRRCTSAPARFAPTATAQSHRSIPPYPGGGSRRRGSRRRRRARYASRVPSALIRRKPRYGTSDSGMTTEPSCCWFFSRIAARVRPMGSPEPLRVATSRACRPRHGCGCWPGGPGRCRSRRTRRSRGSGSGSGATPRCRR